MVGQKKLPRLHPGTINRWKIQKRGKDSWRIEYEGKKM